MENFVLPAKWCITTTEESNKVICDYYNELFPNDKLIDYNIGNHFCCDTTDSDKYVWQGWIASADHKKVGFEEITFEQFQKYVMKDPLLDLPSVITEDMSYLNEMCERLNIV